jgi:hypothetical protein
VEEFLIWRRLHTSDGQLSARQVEAFLILDKELSAELEYRRRSERG